MIDIKLVASNRTHIRDEISPYSFIHNVLFPSQICNDRFDWLTQFSLINWEKCNEYDNFVKFVNQSNYNISDFLDQRIQRVVEKIGDKTAYVSWSGGIDSTYTVICLLQYLKPGQLQIIASSESVYESGEIFRWLINKAKLQAHIVNFGLFDQFFKDKKDYYLITGECSDQCFGYGKIMNFPDKAVDWKDGIDKFVKYFIKRNIGLIDLYKQLGIIDIIQSRIDQINKVLPTPITRFDQWCCFWNNTIKTTYIRYITRMNTDNDYLRDHIISLFDDQDVLNYGLINTNNNPQYEVKSFKHVLKEFVVAQTKIVDFYNKKKTISYVYENYRDRFSYFDSDGYHFVSNDIDQYDKYNWILDHFSK